MREPYVFQCSSRSENFKLVQVLKISLKTLFAILLEAFDTSKMMLSVSASTLQSVRTMVMVLGTESRFLSFYTLYLKNSSFRLVSFVICVLTWKIRCRVHHHSLPNQVTSCCILHCCCYFNSFFCWS